MPSEGAGMLRRLWCEQGRARWTGLKFSNASPDGRAPRAEQAKKKRKNKSKSFDAIV
jgi:hypothetical protein